MCQFLEFLDRLTLRWRKEADSPEQSDAALGGGGHGAVVVNSVLGGDVVLQEQALGVLLLQGVPLAGIL